MIQIVRDLKFDLRPNSSDEKAVREVVGNLAYEKKDFKILPGEEWLDLGGNVGAFAVLAASRGAKVTSFEPDPLNCERIHRNLSLNALTAEVRERAVVSNDQKSATLNLWPDGQSWRNSLYRNRRGTEQTIVLCENFFSLLKPDHCVKMDIEGAEIPILEAWPEGLRCQKLVFEYSFDVDPSVARLRAILAKMKRCFATVKHTSQVDRIEEWKFFPPATMVHCF